MHTLRLSLPAEPKDEEFPASPTKTRFEPPSTDIGRSEGAGNLLFGDNGDGAGGNSSVGGSGGDTVGTLEERGPSSGDDGLWAVPSEASASSKAYLELLETLTHGLDRLIMIRGGGSEVVTIFN